MPDLLVPRCRAQAVLLIGLVAAQANAQVPSHAAMEPVPGLHVSYERFGPEGIATPPGRFDGALATPLGTLRTSVHAVPAGEQHFQRGDTSFEWATPVLGGQLQLRDLQAGGTAAAWRTRLDAGLTAKTECDWTPARSGQALHLTQDLGDGHVAQALLSTARTAAGQAARWDFEILQAAGGSRWNAGIEAAEQGYVSAAGAQEARAGVRVGTQWRLFPHAWMEARYALQLRGDVQEPASRVMVGTRFDLPRRVSLATSVETDAAAYHKASLTLAMPLELR